jgi:hypothetical protein
MRTEEFYTFIRERESIRLKKAQGLPFPWTSDPILQQYKFTNVRREHDKTSQKLIEMFYHTRADRYEVLLNCATFRYFGTWEFAQALGWQESFQPKKIIKLARDRLNKGERVFTGAYLITNTGITGPKEEIVVNVFLKELWKQRDRIIEIIEDQNNWEATTKVMMQIKGFGGSGFMAKETLLDTMYCKGFWRKDKPSDYNTWTPIGPGGRRGINRLLNQPIDTKMPEEEMLGVILQLTAAQKGHWPSEWGELAPTELQFQCCEYDKWWRVKSGQGRPRSRYRAS